MSSVREIVSAIEKLPPAEFHRVQARIERIAERIWQKEHQRATGETRKAGITDDDIDQFVLRRRYRGRAR